MGLLFETHCHSYVSDGVGSPELLVRIAASKGIRVISVTDHDTFRGSVLAWRAARYLGLDVLVIYGAEVLTNWGDILVYCLEPLRDPLPYNALELRDLASSNNCLLVAPHPFQPLLPSVGRMLVREPRVFDAVEVWNGKSIPVTNIPAILYAKKLGKPAISGSDAHVPSAVGVSPTVLEHAEKPEEVLEAMRKGLVKPKIGIPSLRTLLEDIAWSIYRRI